MLDFLTNFDQTLDTLASSLGHWTYVVTFLTIFAETGLVVMPFLPGDSLLFAVGILCSREDTGLRLEVFLPALWVAAVLGNYVNFRIGRALAIRLGGKPGIEAVGVAIGKLFGGRFARFARPSDLVKAEVFFAKWGLLAVGVARFLPFLRTLIPFVAGMSDMRQGPFLVATAIGGFAWVGVCTMLGYWAGNIPWVRANFTSFILCMFVLGFVPVAISSVRKWLAARAQPTSPKPLPDASAALNIDSPSLHAQPGPLNQPGPLTQPGNMQPSLHQPPLTNPPSAAAQSTHLSSPHPLSPARTPISPARTPILASHAFPLVPPSLR